MTDRGDPIKQLIGIMNRLNETLLLAKRWQFMPETVQAIDRLTDMLALVALKTEALTERQFRELIERPTVADGERNAGGGS